MPKLNRKSIRKRVKSLISVRIFWAITLLGNACIFIGAALFHWLEFGTNPHVGEFIDSLTWAVGIVTTVGGGNIAPTTFYGKVLGIFMMMGGAVFLWSYMALFIGILVEPELANIQREVDEIQHDVKDLTSVKES